MELLREVRHATRALARTPSLALIVILCLGIGIGANTTVFSWMENMVLRPTPAVQDTRRIALVFTLDGREEANVSYPAYIDLRDNTRTMSGLAGFVMNRVGLQDPAQPEAAAEPVWGVFATGNYFDVLGVRAALGRVLQPADARVKGDGTVAVIGWALWQRRFGGDPNIVGRQIRVDGHQLTIVGVASPNFAGTYAGLSLDMWIPITMAPVLGGDPDLLEKRGLRWVGIFGRMRPGITLAQVRDEISGLSRRLGALHPEDRDHALSVMGWHGGPGQKFMQPLLTVMLGVTGIVLLVVCSNLASLLLARGASRQRELGVRVALGASRARLVRQLLIEGALLGVGGALVAIAITAWARGLLGDVMPRTNLPIVIDPALDLRVLGFTAALSVGACLLFALLPALRASKLDVVSAIKSGGAGAVAHSRVRAGLVVAQVAFALTAIVCAGLFVRSVSALRRVDVGFRDAEHVLLFPTDLTLAGAVDSSAQRRLTTGVLERVRSLPGVRAAALASQVPLGFDGWATRVVRVPGYTPRRNESMAVMTDQITSGYFQGMGVPILDGRGIDDTDRPGAATAVVVNQEFVRRYLGGRPAIGERIFIGREAVIVGVVGNGKYRFDQLDQASPPFMYLSQAQFGAPGLTLHVRTDGTDPTALVARIRRELVQVAPTLPFSTPMTLAEYASAAVVPEQLGSRVLSVLGILALLLSAVGLYGRLAYAVTQRTREIGIRLAIGASPAGVVRTFMVDGAKVAAVGAGIGIVLALLSGRVLASTLPKLPSVDVVILASSVAVLVVVALAASYLPARRAARTDPLGALKYE